MEIAIDLGTANVLVAVRGKGIVLREPSVVTVDRNTGKLVAIGEEARQMLGRTPGAIAAMRPLRDGVIADYEITEAMLRHFIARVTPGRSMTRPRVMICIPTGATGAERTAVGEAARSAGAGKVELIEEPLAAALGVGLEITKPEGHMVVDIGGGTADVAVLTLGGKATSDSVRVGGDAMDSVIVQELKSTYSLAIGERTAEEIKINVGSVHPQGTDRQTDIRGRDLLTGLPRTLHISSSDIRPGLTELAMEVVASVRRVLEQTPPELISDILDHGIWLTGGGAMLHGLPELISRETGVPTQLAEDPMSSVALGTARALDLQLASGHLVVFQRVI